MTWGYRVRLTSLVASFLRRSSFKPLTLLSLVALIACSASDGGQPAPHEKVGESHAALCTAATITASIASPAPLNATVRLTANASCGTASPEYRFAWQMGGSDATTFGFINDWSSSNFVDWNTTQFSGSYTLYAYARSAGGTNFESAAILGSYLVGPVCGTTSFPMSPAPVIRPPPPPGTQFTFSPTSPFSFRAPP